MCDNGWDLNDAQVVCRELGFGPAIVARQKAFYGPGSGQILLRHMQCDGMELKINNCPTGASIIDDCDHYKDAGAECVDKNGNLHR